MKYCSEITGTGSKVEEMAEQNMLILFGADAPEVLAEYCIIHKNIWPEAAFDVGDNLYLGQHEYEITAFGNMAKDNLKLLGHVTLVFDGAKEAALDGHIHLKGMFYLPKIGEEIVIL